MRTILLRDDQVVVLRYALALACMSLGSTESGFVPEDVAKEKENINEIKLLLDAGSRSRGDEDRPLRAAA